MAARRRSDVAADARTVQEQRAASAGRHSLRPRAPHTAAGCQTEPQADVTLPRDVTLAVSAILRELLLVTMTDDVEEATRGASQNLQRRCITLTNADRHVCGQLDAVVSSVLTLKSRLAAMTQYAGTLERSVFDISAASSSYQPTARFAAAARGAHETHPRRGDASPVAPLSADQLGAAAGSPSCAEGISCHALSTGASTTASVKQLRTDDEAEAYARLKSQLLAGATVHAPSA